LRKLEPKNLSVNMMCCSNRPACIGSQRSLQQYRSNATMQPVEQRALLTIALLAAFADGAKADREREEIRRIAGSIEGTFEVHNDTPRRP